MRQSEFEYDCEMRSPTLWRKEERGFCQTVLLGTCQSRFLSFPTNFISHYRWPLIVSSCFVSLHPFLSGPLLLFAHLTWDPAQCLDAMVNPDINLHIFTRLRQFFSITKKYHRRSLSQPMVWWPRRLGRWSMGADAESSLRLHGVTMLRCVITLCHRAHPSRHRTFLNHLVLLLIFCCLFPGVCQLHHPLPFIGCITICLLS